MGHLRVDRGGGTRPTWRWLNSSARRPWRAGASGGVRGSGQSERGRTAPASLVRRRVSTSTPVTPSSMYVAGPPPAGATTTSPEAIASSMAMPNSSLRLATRRPPRRAEAGPAHADGRQPDRDHVVRAVAGHQQAPAAAGEPTHRGERAARPRPGKGLRGRRRRSAGCTARPGRVAGPCLDQGRHPLDPVQPSDADRERQPAVLGSEGRARRAQPAPERLGRLDPWAGSATSHAAARGGRGRCLRARRRDGRRGRVEVQQLAQVALQLRPGEDDELRRRRRVAQQADTEDEVLAWSAEPKWPGWQADA